MPSILIVDDEPHIRLLLEQTLEDFEDEGVDIITAENGEEGLAIIREETPEVVFLDVMMPLMNGFDVCNAVKNELKLKNVTVILLTAKGQEFDRKKGKEVGADLYITKPFNPDEIVEIVNGILFPE